MGSLFQIVYTSTADTSLSPAALVDLLNDSVRRNVRLGITGLLLHHDGMFMHVLEGEEIAVIALYAKILRDPRHHNVIPLIHEPVEKRLFANSSIMFRASDLPELLDWPGYRKFLQTPLKEGLRASEVPKCLRLFLLFKHKFR